MVELNEITLLFIHIFSCISFVCVHPYLCLHYVPCLLLVWILCFDHCMSMTVKIIPMRIWPHLNTKTHFVYILTASMRRWAICAITARDGRLIIFPGFMWPWFTMYWVVNEIWKVLCILYSVWGIHLKIDTIIMSVGYRKYKATARSQLA